VKNKTGTLIILSGAIMEVSWLYAWASFLSAAILQRSFPFPEAVGTFGLAAILTRLARGKGWRVLCVLGLQVCGYALAALRIIHVFFYSSYPFFGTVWLERFWRQERNPQEWGILIFLFLIAFFFWLGGLALARRPMDFSPLCSRFDSGVAAFIILFLIKLLLEVRGDIRVEERLSELCLFPFFIFSLLAMGLVRNRGEAERDFLPGYRSAGVILSFSITVLMLGTGLVLFFSTYLTQAAEVGYDLLQVVAEPIGPIIAAIFRFLYLPRMTQTGKEAKPSGGGEESFGPPIQSSGWSEWLEKVLAWGVLALLVVFFLLLMGIVVFYLVRWLLSRTETQPRQTGQGGLLSSWAERMRAFLLACWDKCVSLFGSLRGPVQLYGALQVWGQRSGISRRVGETPTEYGLRLQGRFPALQKEIRVIIAAFNEVVYGEIAPGEKEISDAHSAWRRLCSPLHWPSRLKAWLIQV
jgi:hypothetical protein